MNRIHTGRRNYYYNKHNPKEGIYKSDLKFNKNEFESWVLNNEVLKIKLVQASEYSGVKIHTLKIVLHAIGCCSGDFCTVASQEKIAEIANLCKKTVNSAIKGLRKAGILIVFHRYKKINGDTLRTTSLMIINAFFAFVDWVKQFKLKAQEKLKMIASKTKSSVKQKFNDVRWVGDDKNGYLMDYRTGEITYAES